eukprot:3663656-Amphidinium_carterae.1
MACPTSGMKRNRCTSHARLECWQASATCHASVASSSDSESSNVDPMLGHEHEDEALEMCTGPPA